MKTEMDAAEVSSQLKKVTRLRPSLGLILGTGFQGVSGSIRSTAEIAYSSLPGFPIPDVEGHAGKLLIGYIGPAPVIVLSGRCHYYEGHSMDAVAFPVRVLAEFGVKDLVITSAAGGINPRFKPGHFMGFTDHLNLMGTTPLRGPATATGGASRFVDLTETYDRSLGKLLRVAAKNVRIPLRWGVYAAVCGPCYETPAEIRAFAQLGADAVGMSTVPEVIVARQCRMAVAALSCITNPAAGRNKKPLSHDEVLAMGRKMQNGAAQLIARFVELYASRK